VALRSQKPECSPWRGCASSAAACDSIILKVGILGVGAGMPELGSGRLPRQTQRHLQTPSMRQVLLHKLEPSTEGGREQRHDERHTRGS
jgi:hypothetical protein